MPFLQNLLDLALEAAPWLVLGLFLGGLMKALIPTNFLQKHLTVSGLGSIIKAALLGAPLPLCSCGVIPAALGLRKAGASKPATTSFLVSTPETGIDSISITYAMMGGFMAIVRPIAALVSAVVSGLLVSWFDPKEHTLHKQASDSCCSTEPRTNCCDTNSDNTYSHKEKSDSCCSSEAPSNTQSSLSWLQNAWSGVHYAFTQLLNDIGFWLVIGLVFAAAVQTWLPPSFLAQWGSGIIAMLVMLLAGIPMYICATASTPIAAGLILAGVSPGAALVLLLAGPATNISTLGVISQELGKRSMMLYLAGVSVTAVLSGLIVDALIKTWSIDITTVLHDDHSGLPITISWIALILLISLILLANVKKYMIKS